MVAWTRILTLGIAGRATSQIREASTVEIQPEQSEEDKGTKGAVLLNPKELAELKTATYARGTALEELGLARKNAESDFLHYFIPSPAPSPNAVVAELERTFSSDFTEPFQGLNLVADGKELIALLRHAPSIDHVEKLKYAAAIATLRGLQDFNQSNGEEYYYTADGKISKLEGLKYETALTHITEFREQKRLRDERIFGKEN